MMASNYRKACEEAKTPQQYIAVQIAWHLVDVGELPTLEDMYYVYSEGIDEEFKDRFGTVDSVCQVRDWLADIMRKAIV